MVKRNNMKKIKLFGGFHNSKSTNVQVSDEVYSDLKEQFDGKPYEQCVIIGEYLDEFLTEGQKKRLNKHFCGISGCTCGSYYRDCHIEL